MRRAGPSLWLILFALGRTCAVDYFVSPTGNDAWSGLLAAPAGNDGPWRTLAKAAATAHAGDTVSLRAGSYREVLQPAHDGEAGKPLVFRAYEGEQPVITGADPLTGWQADPAGQWLAPMPWDLKDGNQVFANGRPLMEARWPNSTSLFQPDRAKVATGTETSITDPNLPPGDWTGALLWLASGAEWICQSMPVTRHDPITSTLNYEKPLQNRFYEPREGNPYVLMGVPAALDAPGEWLYDRAAGQLRLLPPDGADPGTLNIEAKRRDVCIDLSDRHHVQVRGLAFRAGTLRTNSSSADLLLHELHGEWLGHSYLNDVSASGAVRIEGQRVTITNCHFAHSSGSVLMIGGSDHRIVNNLIEGGDYAGKWNGTVKLAGRRQYFAWNTVRDSGRDLVSTGGLSESLLEHNDLSNAGWLTHDLGMTYGHNTDFGNTVIRFNRVHDNRAGKTAMGIYFDHCSHNVIVYGNLVWNVGMDPIRINNPAHFNVVAHNSCYRTGPVRTFDHSKRNDVRDCRWIDNLLNAPIQLPDGAVVEGNLVETEPYVAAPDDFTLRAGSAAIGAATWPGLTGPDVGAPAFASGCDLTRPAQLPERFELPAVPYRNAVFNACFELGTLEGWTPLGQGASIAKGNGWGNNYADRAAQFEATGTSKFELKLEGQAGVEQRLEGLTVGKEHALSGWLKVSVAGQAVELRVKGEGVDAVATVDSTAWTRVTVPFTPRGPVTVSIRKTTAGEGFAAADNLGVPRVP